MSRFGFFATFFGISGIYALVVFPHEINALSLGDLLWVTNYSPTDNTDRAYLPVDSALYLQQASGPLADMFGDVTAADALSLTPFANVTVVLVGELGLSLSPSSPLLVVAIVNQLLFVWAVLHYRAICASYGIAFRSFLPLVLLNPLILLSMYTLNKEAIGIFLIAALLRYAREGKTGRLLIVAAISLFTRNVFVLFALLLLVRKRINVTPAFAMLVSASLVLPAVLWATNGALLGEARGPIGSVSQAFDQQTSGLLTWAGDVNQVPLGYLVTYPIVTLINIASPALNPSYWSGHAAGLNWVQAALQASALMFGVMLLAAVRHVGVRSVLHIEPLRLGFALTLITSAYPISQHRYLLPLYPLVVLGFLIARSRSSKRDPAYDVATRITTAQRAPPVAGYRGQRAW